MVLQIEKASETGGGNLMCYDFSLEDAVADTSVTDPDGLWTIKK